MAICSFQVTRNTLALTIGILFRDQGQGVYFSSGGPKDKKSKKFKPYQVDTFRKGKIERNTIKQVSDRLEALIKSYSRFQQIFTQNGPILLIFGNFSRGKIKRFLYLILLHLSNFKLPKIQKKVFWVYFGPKNMTASLQFYPRKLSLIVSESL